MIYRLAHLIPDARCGTQNAAGMWVRAVPLLCRWGFRERLRDAWAALWREDVVVVAWPFAGEFEQAMAITWGPDGDPERKPKLPQPKPLPTNAAPILIDDAVR